MGAIFYWLLNMSILGSVTGILVLLIRRIRILPRFGVYLLWMLPLVRFWIPVGIANRYSLLNFISYFTTKTVVVRKSVFEYTMTNIIQAAEKYFPIKFKTELLADIFNIAGIIWLVVALGAIISSVALYVVTKSALKNANQIKDNIYISDKVLSPAVYGILKPKIILPANISDANIDYILRHEQVHIHRRDNLWRIIAVITACVHWFNPLIWVFLKLFFTDMELACDAGVLKHLADDDKKRYVAALLACSAGKSYYASTFGGYKIRLRIENILSYKNLTLLSSICFTVFFVVITVAIITNAVGG